MDKPITITELMDAGYLVRPAYFSPRTTIDEKQRAFEDMAADALRSYIKHGNGRKCLVFCKHLTHVDYVSELFKDAGLKFDQVTHRHNARERRAVIAGFRECGDVDGLISCSILLDEEFPDVECVIMLKDTDSKFEFIRMARFAMMKTRKKKESVIFDCVGNYKRFGMLY